MSVVNIIKFFDIIFSYHTFFSSVKSRFSLMSGVHQIQKAVYSRAFDVSNATVTISTSFPSPDVAVHIVRKRCVEAVNFGR